MKDRNKKGGRRRKKNGPPPEKLQIKYPELTCAICGEAITDVSNAIAYGEEGNPAHFDCVIKELNKNEDLGSGERIVYMGSGNFAVIVAERQEGSPFRIIRKLVVEEFKELPWWRREIKTQLKR